MAELAELVASLELDCDIAEELAIDRQKQLEEIYEVVVGDDGINRYTHEEIIDRLKEMYDCYKYVIDNVYSKGEYLS